MSQSINAKPMSMAIMEALKKMVSRVPGWAWLAVGGLLAAAFWLMQHDARIRRQAEFQQARQQASTEVASLKKQAAQDVAQANVINAKALQQIEARRLQIEQQNQQLAAQLTRLRLQAQTQADEVATLPLAEVSSRVATQLGFKPEDLAVPGGEAQNKLRMTNDELPRPGGVGAAGKCHPEEPQATRDPGISDAATDRGDCRKQTAGILRSAQDDKRNAPDEKRTAQDDKRTAQDDSPVALALTASGARKVETALVELNACRAESDIQTQQLQSCQARAKADDASIERLNGSVASLNQALQAKDKILDRQQAEYQAELRAARGTFWGRLARVSKHVAIGVAVGVVIGVATR